MPEKDVILNLPSFSIKKISGHNPLILDVHYRKNPRWGRCGGKKVRKKACYERQVRHVPIGHRQTLLRFKAYKVFCHTCQRYSNQLFPGIGKYQRATHRLKEQVFTQHTQGISRQDLSGSFKISKSTVERWFHQIYQLAHKEFDKKPCPQVLGIDEHFFSKKTRLRDNFL